MAAQNMLPVRTARTHRKNVKISAKMATPSLSNEPATEREM